MQTATTFTRSTRPVTFAAERGRDNTFRFEVLEHLSAPDEVLADGVVYLVDREGPWQVDFFFNVLAGVEHGRIDEEMVLKAFFAQVEGRL